MADQIMVVTRKDSQRHGYMAPNISCIKKRGLTKLTHKIENLTTEIDYNDNKEK